jgi:hypothetical protein
MTRALLAVAVGAAALAALPSPAHAAHEELVVTGLTQTDKLVTFVAGSGERLSQVKVSGVEAGQRLVAIDYRPATGGLYGVAVDGASGYLYALDAGSGRAVRVGTSAFPVTGDVSIDFNPTVDRLRVVSSAGDNLRVNPNTGARGDVPTNDGRLSYGLVDAAYTNNDTDPATGTTLFDIDAAGDQLVRQDPPNAGTLTAVGALGVSVGGATGFDVYSEKLVDGTTRNIALLSRLTDEGTLVHVVNLTTGAVTSAAGVRAQGAPVVDIAVSPAQ